MADTSICCGSRPVVVLADREKEEMDDELRHSLKGYQIEWHTRSGAPHCSSDLDRVAAGQAKNVILLDDNTEVGGLHIVSLNCIATGLLSQQRCFANHLKGIMAATVHAVFVSPPSLLWLFPKVSKHLSSFKRRLAVPSNKPAAYQQLWLSCAKPKVKHVTLVT